MSRHLEQYDENGNRIDIYLNDDEVKVGNKTLAEKLDEIEDEIDGAGGYDPPQEGIPASDLAGDIPKAKLSQGVQDSLGKADNAIQGVTVNNTPVTPDGNKKVNITVPTKTSDLDNDSDFVTQDDLPEGVSVDTQLADSGNPIANRAVNSAVNSLQTAISSLQSALDTLIGSGNVQGAIDTFNEVTAFLNGISSSDTLAAKLAQIQQSIPSVDGLVNEQQVETMIEEAMEDVGGGSVESVTVSGTKYTPDENGDVDLGNLRGQDGNSGVASADGLESVNNLNGGTTDTQQKVYVLGANQGKRLKDQIDYVYARLQAVYAAIGNIAFWDGKPSSAIILPALDWGMPKHTVTLDLDLTHVVVKNGTTEFSDGDTILVEEGATLELTIDVDSGYQIDTLTSQVGTIIGNVVSIVMGQTDITLDITAVATKIPETFSISYQLTNCEHATGVTNPTTITEGSSTPTSIQLKCNSGYGLTLDDINVQNATKGTLTEIGGVYTLTISNATANVTIAATAALPSLKFLNAHCLVSDSTDFVAISDTLGEAAATTLCVSELIKINAPSTQLGENDAMPKFTQYWGAIYGSGVTRPVAFALYQLDNGILTPLWRANPKTSGKYAEFEYSSSAATYATGKTIADIKSVFNAGQLCVRMTCTKNGDNNIALGASTLKLGSVSIVGGTSAGKLNDFSFTNNATGFAELVISVDYDDNSAE